MENIKNAIEAVEQLESKYALSTEEIKKIKESFDDFRVYVPLIGKFSVGKSALINMILGWGIEACKENINPETEIPTEIFAGREDLVCICRPEKEFIDMEQYMDMRESLSFKNAEVVKLQLRSDVLDQFPNVALVDMPGLDSGYEDHNKAIDYYIRRSMAYILVFSAEEPIVTKSMEPILADLDTYEMPICAVITKGNRITGVEEQRKDELRRLLAKYFGSRRIPVFVTERENGRVDDLVAYLVSLNQQSDDIGKKVFRNRLEPEFARICNYLFGYLKNMDLSLSQLEEEQDRLNSDIEKLKKTVNDELDAFAGQIPKLVNDVASDVQSALSAKTEEYIADLMNETDISGEINETVRAAVTASYQKKIIPKLQRQLKDIAASMSLGTSNYSATLMIDADKACGKEISGIGRTAIDVIAFLLGPAWGPFLSHLLTGMFNKNVQEKRREAKMKIRQQLCSGVFPSVDREVRAKIEIDLKNMISEVRGSLEQDVDAQIESLQKSLDEVIRKKEAEDRQKESDRAVIESDIRRIQEVQAAIQPGKIS